MARETAGPGAAGPDDDRTQVFGAAQASVDSTAAEASDPMSDTLHPAMAVSTPTGSFDEYPAPQVKAGDIFGGRYRLDQQLAQRGGTLTWRAFDQKLSRSVLVHVMGHDDPRTGEVLEAARKAAFATDSRFLRVLDAVPGENPDEPSLVVCEFAPGESLERLLRQGPLSALEAAWVARELADALAVMHAEGLFHQRINPDTVIITATGNVKIVGFLIEAAMHPDGGEGTLAWSERERADVQALGKVLYASLVTRWPTSREQLLDAHGEPTITWGMPPAPMDSHGWLTPRQIRSGVSPALDMICNQILSDAPRHNEMPLRTAHQVVLALGKVLGTADAAADLERRMRYPMTRAESANEPSVPLMDRTGRIPAVERTGSGPVVTQPGPGGRPSGRRNVAGGDDDTVLHQTTGQQGTGRQPALEDHDEDPSPQQYLRATPSRLVAQGTRPHPRRWLGILVALVGLALLLGLLKVANRQSDVAGGGAGEQQGGGTLAISSVAGFDPPADGGNGEENPAQVRLATDGNPATAWRSVVYLGNPKLGGLKPGVGLVVDLGKQQKVSRVKLTLVGQPTGVQLRVPADTGVDTPPTTSATQWQSVASKASAGTSVTLEPEQELTTRYLMVYLTSLPKVANNRYQAGVAEIEVVQ